MKRAKSLREVKERQAYARYYVREIIDSQTKRVNREQVKPTV